MRIQLLAAVSIIIFAISIRTVEGRDGKLSYFTKSEGIAEMNLRLASVKEKELDKMKKFFNSYKREFSEPTTSRNIHQCALAPITREEKAVRAAILTKMGSLERNLKDDPSMTNSEFLAELASTSEILHRFMDFSAFRMFKALELCLLGEEDKIIMLI